MVVTGEGRKPLLLHVVPANYGGIVKPANGKTCPSYAGADVVAYIDESCDTHFIPANPCTQCCMLRHFSHLHTVHRNLRWVRSSKTSKAHLQHRNEWEPEVWSSWCGWGKRLDSEASFTIQQA